MKLFWPILILLVTESLCVRAQWPDYGVYHTVGLVKCAPAKGGAAQVIRKGSWIYAGDKLLLTDASADLILFDRDSNYLHLRGKGSYTTADLQTLRRSHVQDNITCRYLSLLWDELFRPGEGEAGTGATGGVSRGLSLVLAPAEDYKTSLDRILFRWQRVAWATGYRLKLNDSAGQAAFDSVVTDTQAVVRVRLPLSYGSTYRWSLELLGAGGRHQVGDTGRLALVDEATLLPALAAKVTPPDPELSAGPNSELVLTEVFERQGCTQAALGVYRRLLKTSPDDKAIRVLYRQFQRRNGLED